MANGEDDKDLENERQDDESDAESDPFVGADEGGAYTSDLDSRDDAEASDAEDARIAAREAEAIAKEERELGRQDASPIAVLMGVERWVQFGYLAFALITFFVLDALIRFGWQFFAEPDGTIVSGIAALIAIGGTFALYRHPRTNELAHEVVGELSKVTWPTRDETYYSTVVVIVTSVIAAVYTGVFDALWSKFTDLIYTI
jgi:preprotein translocase SecE subunit